MTGCIELSRFISTAPCRNRHERRMRLAEWARTRKRYGLSGALFFEQDGTPALLRAVFRGASVEVPRGIGPGDVIGVGGITVHIGEGAPLEGDVYRFSVAEPVRLGAVEEQ